AGQPAGLVEARLRAVLQAFLAVAQEGPDHARLRVDGLDLVIIAVGDVERPVVPAQADAVLQQRGIARAVLVPEIEEARADERPHLARRVEVDFPDRADLAVGDVDLARVDREAARLRELRVAVRAVLDVLAAVPAERGDGAFLEVEGPDLVI